MRVLVTAGENVAAVLAPTAAGEGQLLRPASVGEALRHLYHGGPTVLVAGEEEDLGPLRGLPPPIRRHVVVVLVGPGLTTGDWLGAFVRGVNLTVNSKDLDHLPRLVQAAVERRRELAALIEGETPA